MSSFKGSFTYTVDSKGRINIPAKMRKNLAPEANNSFVITRGFESCIFLYPQDEWVRLEQSIRKLSPTNPQHRFFTRALLQWATDAELDGQSRINLPKELMQFAGVENEVFILGVHERIEVWNPKTYQEYLSGQKEDYIKVAETVFQNGQQ